MMSSGVRGCQVLVDRVLGWMGRKGFQSKDVPGPGGCRSRDTGTVVNRRFVLVGNHFWYSQSSSRGG